MSDIGTTFKTKGEIIQANMESYWKAMAIHTPYLKIRYSDQHFCTYNDLKDAIFNSVIRSEFPEEDIDNEVNRIIVSYTMKHMPFCWWVNASHSSYPTLSKKLNDVGMMAFAGIEGMMIDLEKAEVQQLKTQLSKTVRMKLISTAEAFNDWIEPIAICFNMSKETAKIYMKIFQTIYLKNPDIMHNYTIYENNKPCSSGTIFYDQENGVASYYNGATLPGYRSKGIFTALTKMALLASQENGYKSGVIHSTPSIKHLLQTIGFETCINYIVYVAP